METHSENESLIEVYHLYRGNWRTDEQANCAEDIRMRLREVENDDSRITSDEFEDLYEKVGEEVLIEGTTGKLLNRVWKRWNATEGGIETSPAFENSHCRSLEVGDIIIINQIKFVCKPFGWEKQPNL